MNEITRLDQMLAGIIPSNFSNMDYDRKNCEFTWNDCEFNINNKPFFSETAIIVTSYQAQLGWLKATLTEYRKSGAYVILAYDNLACIWNNLDDSEYFMKMFPHPLHYLLAHSVVVKHKTYDADKRTGWFWDVWYGSSIVNSLPNIKYVYITNGDCITENPGGFKELPGILGNGDFMSGQSIPRGTIHTANLFLTSHAFRKIMNYISIRMHWPVMASQSPEMLLRDAVDELGLKETFVKQPVLPDGSIDYYCTHNLPSTWKDVLGFRNLYAEFEYRENNGLEPLDKKYLDPFRDYFYFRSDWRDTVCMYYKTGDRRYLGMFWDRGKDTDTERKFLPLEDYGREPILA